MRILGAPGGRGDVVIDEVIYALFVCVHLLVFFGFTSFVLYFELGWEFGQHSVDIS